MPGVIDNGFQTRTYSEIKAEIDEKQKAKLTPELNVVATGIAGQLNGLNADKIREMWDLGSTVFRGVTSETATGDQLDESVQLAGLARLGDRPGRAFIEVWLESFGNAYRGDTLSDAQGNKVKFVANFDSDASWIFPAVVEVETVEAGADVAFAPRSIVMVDGASEIVPYPLIMSELDYFDQLVLVEGFTLTMIVDEGDEQTFTVTSSDFPSWGAGTISATELAAAIASQIVGTTTAVYNPLGSDGKIQVLSSTKHEDGGSIQITGGTLNEFMRFSTELVKGYNLQQIQGLGPETDEELKLRKEAALRTEDKGNADAMENALQGLPNMYGTEVTEDFDVADLEAQTLIKHMRGALGPAVESATFAQRLWDTKGHGVVTNGVPLAGFFTGLAQCSDGFFHIIRFTGDDPVNVEITYQITVDGNIWKPGDEYRLRNLVFDLMNSKDDGEILYSSELKVIPFEIAGVLNLTGYGTPVVGTEDNFDPGARSRLYFSGWSSIIVEVTKV
jgi:hypothetical protein